MPMRRHAAILQRSLSRWQSGANLIISHYRSGRERRADVRVMLTAWATRNPTQGSWRHPTS
jgi:hypothetical protein